LEVSLSLAEFNALPRYRAEAELLRCCGSKAWARTVAGRRPFLNLERLLKASSEVWWRFDPVDWSEVVGGDKSSEQRIRAAAQQQDRTTRWCLERLFTA
jgi:2-oxo-4-hydroxy-4-carboxy-5-ureidoimidazoline decarboxylase